MMGRPRLVSSPLGQWSEESTTKSDYHEVKTALFYAHGENIIYVWTYVTLSRWMKGTTHLTWNNFDVKGEYMR